MNKQPKALRILIPTEMSETFGYFTVQAILIFYLINALSFSDAEAYAFSGEFIALAYILPIIGGWLADYVLGNRMSIWLGGIFLCSGYALLALGHHTLLLGLSFVIVGNGLLKPNVSSFIGEFYDENDPRREAGFTLVYSGISIGALLAIGTVGYIQTWFGWSTCFAVASFVLFLGISVFRWGYHFFDNKGLPPQSQLKKVTFFRKQYSLIICLGILLTVVSVAMKVVTFGNDTVYFFGFLFCAYIAKIAWKLDNQDRRAILALMILFVIAIFYKAMFFETYLTFNVFTERLVDRSIWGHEIPATTFLSLSSLFTIILGPIFAKMWLSNKIRFSIMFKFALSLLIMGFSMHMLAIWIKFAPGEMLSMSSIILFRLFFSISELFILPLGIAIVTEYSPKHCVGVMMGGWFLTAAYGGKLAGILANFANIPHSVTNIQQMQNIYHYSFQMDAFLNYALFALCLLLIPIINNLLSPQRNRYETKITPA